MHRWLQNCAYPSFLTLPQNWILLGYFVFFWSGLPEIFRDPDWWDRTVPTLQFLDGLHLKNGGISMKYYEMKGTEGICNSPLYQFFDKAILKTQPIRICSAYWYTPHLRLALPSAWAAWPSATLWAKILVVWQPLAKPIIVLDEVYIYIIMYV